MSRLGDAPRMADTRIRVRRVSESRRNSPDAWWLIAGPAAGVLCGTVLGAIWGWVATPAERVGPLVGDSVGSTIAGALLGMTLGVFAGLVVGAVLTFIVGRGRPASTARPLAAVVAALCCPAVLLLLTSIGRVDRGQLGTAPFAIVAIAGAVVFAWMVGRTPDRT